MVLILMPLLCQSLECLSIEVEIHKWSYRVNQTSNFYRLSEEYFLIKSVKSLFFSNFLIIKFAGSQKANFDSVVCPFYFLIQLKSIHIWHLYIQQHKIIYASSKILICQSRVTA